MKATKCFRCEKDLEEGDIYTDGHFILCKSCLYFYADRRHLIPPEYMGMWKSTKKEKEGIKMRKVVSERNNISIDMVDLDSHYVATSAGEILFYNNYGNNYVWAHLIGGQVRRPFDSVIEAIDYMFANNTEVFVFDSYLELLDYLRRVHEKQDS